MKLIKRLDLFVAGNFLTLFAGTFCISLFVVMMQFLWKWINELIGKGLSFDVYVQFFFYAAETLVPLALPLAILLASLISFGNMGERLELLAIKAAGISLIRTMRAPMLIVAALTLASFYFQNKVVPEAEQKTLQMMFTIKMKSPELDIPERSFYDGIENINLYVEQKDKETGMLYNVTIYNLQDGVNQAHIILADSARMETSANKMHLLLHLFHGELFENLTSNALQTTNVPYRRETFVEKHFIIDFDTNFNMADQEDVAGSARTKTMRQLTHDIDSMRQAGDSIGKRFYDRMRTYALNIPHETRLSDYDTATIAAMGVEVRRDLEKAEKTEQARKAKAVSVPHSSINFDTLFSQVSPQEKQRIVTEALQRVGMQEIDISGNAVAMSADDRQIRLHEIQYWKKITMSLACLVFFFVGAPLGAIIRKGGLGFPVVVAVIIFIAYYMIDTGAMKVGREGGMPVWLGMWLSTAVLVPLGVFFTIKSNNDSTVFNADRYITIGKSLLGIRPKRHITRKEVIIHDPDYADMHDRLNRLVALSRERLGALPRTTIFGYVAYIVRTWFGKAKDSVADEISQMVEEIVEVLSNSKDRQILLWLNGLPVMDTHSFRFYRRRRKDLRNVAKYAEMINKHIYENILPLQ